MSQSQTTPIVHYMNGTFLVFKTEHAKLLRRRRIMSQVVAYGAPSPSSPGPPYCISHYAAHIVASHGLAEFVHLNLKHKISIEDNRDKFAAKLSQVSEHEKEIHMMRRAAELRRHHLPPTPKNLGEFDSSKVQLRINETPEKELASFEEQVINSTQIISIINDEHGTPQEQMKMRIYHDLYERGFYISSGMKFGSDFLAYMGDPVRYHAQFAIRLVETDDDSGSIDLTSTDFSQINTLQRLLHAASKIPLFVTVDKTPHHKVKYWTLKERIYLNSDSKNTDMELVDPRVDLKSYERIKMKRTS